MLPLAPRLGEGSPNSQQSYYSPKQFKTYIEKKVIPWPEKIQNLVPVGGSDRLNSEYPCLNWRGEVECPAAYSFPEFSKEELVGFATFIDILIRVTG